MIQKITTNNVIHLIQKFDFDLMCINMKSGKNWLLMYYFKLYNFRHMYTVAIDKERHGVIME